MKIGIVGNITGAKIRIARDLAKDFGTKMAKDFRGPSLKKFLGETDSKDADEDFLYYAYMDVIANTQTGLIAASSFVSPFTFIDIFDEYFSHKKAKIDLRPEIWKVASTSMSYYEAVFFMYGYPMESLDFSTFPQGLALRVLSKGTEEKIKQQIAEMVLEMGLTVNGFEHS